MVSAFPEAASAWNSNGTLDFAVAAEPLTNLSSVAHNANTSDGGGSGGNFPMKLHHMLTEIEEKGMSHIVGFRPHGRCFMVHRHKEFVEDVLPRWFKQTKFASFIRQLNMYGFIRMKKGPTKSAYYHEHFLRGQPLLATRISPLQKAKDEMAKQRQDQEQQPNFYKMPSLPSTTVSATATTLETPVAVAAVAPVPKERQQAVSNSATNKRLAAPLPLSLQQAVTATSLQDLADNGTTGTGSTAQALLLSLGGLVTPATRAAAAASSNSLGQALYGDGRIPGGQLAHLFGSGTSQVGTISNLPRAASRFLCDENVLQSLVANNQDLALGPFSTGTHPFLLADAFSLSLGMAPTPTSLLPRPQPPLRPPLTPSLQPLSSSSILASLSRRNEHRELVSQFINGASASACTARNVNTSSHSASRLTDRDTGAGGARTGTAANAKNVSPLMALALASEVLQRQEQDSHQHHSSPPRLCG